MKVVIFGLSVTSSLANGHAATYRTLMTELARRGHEVLFLERNLPWYAERRDIPRSRFGRVEIYETLEELHHQHVEEVRTADCVIVGSSIPEAAGVADWVASESSGVTGFYDVETSLLRFAGVEDAVTLYYGVDPLLYFPKTEVFHWDLASLESYTQTHESLLDQLMFGPARLWPEGRFAVAGQHYPWKLDWPENVVRIPHLSWTGRRDFYNSQCFMLHSAASPAVCLFEAAACATPVIAYPSTEVEKLFQPGVEIFFAETAEDILRIARDTTYLKRANIGWGARRRVLREHTITNRIQMLEACVLENREELKIAAD